MSEKGDEDGELEQEVKRIIKDAYEEDERGEKLRAEHVLKINSCKRDAAVYFVFGCGAAYAASEFAIASWLPIKFGNLENAGLLVGGTVVNTTLACYCFRRSIKSLKKLAYIN